MRYGNPRFDDPKDLGNWSSAVFRLMLQSELLDFARRYYQRRGDEKSLARADEIKKVLRHVIQLKTEAIGALVPPDLMLKLWEARDLYKSKISDA